jgi:hypothetical protein
MPGKKALIFGASGVTGWAFVNEILNDYPEKGVWDQVHALTNRQLDRSFTLWPNDSRLDLVSGIDLLAGTQEELEAAIKSSIPDVDQVTHVYYLGKWLKMRWVQENSQLIGYSVQGQQGYESGTERCGRHVQAIDNGNGSSIVESGVCGPSNWRKDVWLSPAGEPSDRLYPRPIGGVDAALAGTVP